MRLPERPTVDREDDAEYERVCALLRGAWSPAVAAIEAHKVLEDDARQADLVADVLRGV